MHYACSSVACCALCCACVVSVCTSPPVVKEHACCVAQGRLASCPAFASVLVNGTGGVAIERFLAAHPGEEDAFPFARLGAHQNTPR